MMRWDVEANALLDHTSIDYAASPYKLKPSFTMHCIVVEHHESGAIFAFYDGDTYVLDGRGYNESSEGFSYALEAGYAPVEYTHLPLTAFPDWAKQNVRNCKIVAHNGINYDWLVTKLYYGMDYSVVPDTWYGNTVDIVDTLVMSKTLNPDRFGGHSLDNLSSRVGLRKIDFRPKLNKEDKFKHFAADMLYYCIRDVRVNTLVYEYLLKEAGDWDWSKAIELEKSVAELITRQEHRGFKFNKELAESNIQKLDEMMEECRQRIEPLLPPKKATKGYMKDFTPPKRQFKKDGTPSADLIKFADKVGGQIVGEVGDYNFVFDEKTFGCPLDTEKPLRDTQVASINDTTHIKEWLVFSKFKSWMETQDWEGKELDKDILVPGNKVYSPETCVFVDRVVNVFLIDGGAMRGQWPLGVHWHKRDNKFAAKCMNPFTKKRDHLGYHDDPNQAHLAWKKRKHELACQLADLQTDQRVADALRVRYA